MNAAAALAGALAGPVLVLVGYSGLGLVTMSLVIVVTGWTLGRTRESSRRSA